MIRVFLRCLLLSCLIAPVSHASSAVPPAVDPTPREEDWCIAAHQGLNQKAKKGEFDVLMIGDSITWEWDADGWEGNKETGLSVWSELAGFKPGTFAVSGDRTEHLLWRLMNGNLDVASPPKAVVLLIGTNNIRQREDAPEEIVEGIKAILKSVEDRFPQAGILVYGILPGAKLPNDPSRKTTDITNELISHLADGTRVRYVNINNEFLNDDGTSKDEMFRDGLHLSGLGYQAWARSLKQELPKFQD